MESLIIISIILFMLRNLFKQGKYLVCFKLILNFYKQFETLQMINSKH